MTKLKYVWNVYPNGYVTNRKFGIQYMELSDFIWVRPIDQVHYKYVPWDFRFLHSLAHQKTHIAPKLWSEESLWASCHLCFKLKSACHLVLNYVYVYT